MAPRDPAAGIATLRQSGTVVATRFPIIGKVWVTTTYESTARVLKDSATFTMCKESDHRGVDAYSGPGIGIALLLAKSRGGPDMSWSFRSFAPLGALTLATGFVIGAAVLVSAHDGSLSEQDICSTTTSAATAEAPFMAENDAAMKKMMDGMAAKPTGDVDADFVAMMVPHHQGAIDMAVAVLRYGRNARIRRLAQEIIVTQQEEIAAMRLAVDQPLPTSVPSPTEMPSTQQIDPKSGVPANPMMEP
jgi:hypothetical protein